MRRRRVRRKASDQETKRIKREKRGRRSDTKLLIKKLQPVKTHFLCKVKNKERRVKKENNLKLVRRALAPSFLASFESKMSAKR